MKTKPSPGDLRPRTPHDPEGFDAVAYRWDESDCKTCPFWGGLENPQPREKCPRIPAGAGLSSWDRLACLTANRPTPAAGNVKYFRRLYGNEEEG